MVEDEVKDLGNAGDGSEHSPGELEQMGGLRALTGVWKMFIQHGADIITNDEAVREDFVRKTLGVGWDEIKPVLAAIDLVEDTSDAFTEVLSHGLYIQRPVGHHGEAYLRLWGVLNAAYLMASAIRSLYSFFRPNLYKTAAERIESHPVYEWRMRLGSHVLDYAKPGGKKYHRIVARDMYRSDGMRSFVASDEGLQTIQVLEQIRDYERTCMAVLLELTKWKAPCIIKRKSDHYRWMQERLVFSERTARKP